MNGNVDVTQVDETVMGRISWPAGDRIVSRNLADAIATANQLTIFLAERLRGKTLPNLPKVKREQLSGACFHVAMEHHQAVVELVAHGMHGSATALIRPTVEASFRGLWLALIATDKQLDAVGRDERTAFPPFEQIVQAIEQPIGFAKDRLVVALRGQWWSRLCSYTHTGYQQIGMRLTPSGLGVACSDEEILFALRSAGVAGVMAASMLAVATGDNVLAEEIAARLAELGR